MVCLCISQIMLYKMVYLQIMLYEILYPSTLDASAIFWKKTENTWEKVEKDRKRIWHRSQQANCSDKTQPQLLCQRLEEHLLKSPGGSRLFGREVETLTANLEKQFEKCHLMKQQPPMSDQLASKMENHFLDGRWEVKHAHTNSK